MGRLGASQLGAALLSSLLFGQNHHCLAVILLQLMMLHSLHLRPMTSFNSAPSWLIIITYN